MLHSRLLTAAFALASLGLFTAPADAEIKVRGARAQPAPQRAAAVRISNARAANTATTSYGSNGSNGYGTSTKHSGFGNSYGGYGQASNGYGSGGYNTGYNTGSSLHVGYNSGGFGLGLSIGNCAPARHWVPGSWQHTTERYWVPERCERIWREAVYETRYDSCGRAYRVCVQSAGWGSVTHPGYWDNRTARVWVAGHYASY